MWPCLQSITLHNIDAKSENLDRFFEQHALTLKHVTMETIVLLDGTWTDALEKMSKVLNLKSACVKGYLIGVDPRQHWNLEPDIWAEQSDLQSQENRTREAIQDYLVKGGSCPLHDEVAHLQY